MPHLDANALESDPEGMAFLQTVIGKRPGQKGSWSAASTPPTVQPQKLTRRRRATLASFRVGFRLLAFVIVVAAIARSHTRRPAV